MEGLPVCRCVSYAPGVDESNKIIIDPVNWSLNRAYPCSISCISVSVAILSNASGEAKRTGMVVVVHMRTAIY